MTMNDAKLLNFDTSRLAHWDESDPDRLLAEHPELYRNHLVIAKWIDNWIGNMMHPSSGLGGEHQEGFQGALREIAAHLRQGDLLPGGILYDETAPRVSLNAVGFRSPVQGDSGMHREGDVKDLEETLEWIVDEARMFVENGGPVRWVIAEGNVDELPKRIVAETNLPSLVFGSLLAAEFEKPGVRFGPRRLAELMMPELVEAFDQSDLLYLCTAGNLNENDDVMARPTLVDFVTVDHSWAKAWAAARAPGYAGEIRTRRQMLEEALDLRSALSAWERGDDSLQDCMTVESAQRFLTQVGSPGARKAKLRWGLSGADP